MLRNLAMETVTPEKQVALLTRLPANATPPPDAASGEVVLYVDGNWDSTSLLIETDEYTVSNRHIIREPLYNKATWIRYNLPVGHRHDADGTAQGGPGWR
jgi:hypothetical protein